MLFMDLPADVLMNIIKQLNISDLRNVMLTCKSLYQIIINNNTIWRYMHRKTLVIHDMNDSRNKPSNKFSYYHLCRISRNWCSGIYLSRVIIQHNTQYMPWLKLLNNGSLLLSVGSELRYYSSDKRGYPVGNHILWKMNVPTIKRHDVRTNDISRFVSKKNTIVCGNRDGCVAVYHWPDLSSRPRLIHHIKDCHDDGLAEVTAVEVMNDSSRTCIVTACSNNPQVMLWCLNDDDKSEYSSEIYDRQNIYLTDAIGVKCLALNDSTNKLALGLNGNSKPMFLDITKNTLSSNSNDTRNMNEVVRDIQWLNQNTVMYVTHSGKLQGVDVRSEEVIYNTSDPFQSSLYCVKTDGHNAIVVGSREYSRCVLYDTRNVNHLQMYFTQRKSSPVYSLDFDAKKLVAAADRSVALLNFNINVASTEPKDYSHTFELVMQ